MMSPWILRHFDEKDPFHIYTRVTKLKLCRVKNNSEIGKMKDEMERIYIHTEMFSCVNSIRFILIFFCFVWKKYAGSLLKYFLKLVVVLLIINFVYSAMLFIGNSLKGTFSFCFGSFGSRSFNFDWTNSLFFYYIYNQSPKKNENLSISQSFLPCRRISLMPKYRFPRKRKTGSIFFKGWKLETTNDCSNTPLFPITYVIESLRPKQNRYVRLSVRNNFY